MAVIVKKLSEETREVIKGILHSSIFGRCYNFAVMMHRNLGWPLVGILKKNDIVHVGVRSPEGKIWDGRGEVTENEFVSPFIGSGEFSIINTNEEALIGRGEISEDIINLYKEKAQALWPDLHWVGQMYQQKVIAFAEELEDLSREYKLWITAPYSAALPVIFEGYDDEEGYEIEVTADGRTHTINRKL